MKKKVLVWLFTPPPATCDGLFVCLLGRASLHLGDRFTWWAGSNLVLFYFGFIFVFFFSMFSPKCLMQFLYPLVSCNVVHMVSVSRCVLCFSCYELELIEIKLLL